MTTQTIIRQNPLTGSYEVVEGSVKENEVFYNGRYHGLNSSYWVNRKPITSDTKVGMIQVGFKNGAYELANKIQ